jgi:penicillin amidase
MGRALRWGGAAVGLLVVLVLLGYGFLRGGAPRLDGDVRLKGLAADVRVDRDALGVPAIFAHGHLDPVRTLGFLHSQDRFFQMDLMRSLAAGELSDLVGSAAVDFDKRHRLFRLRAVAQEVLARSTPAQRAALDAYTAGVNAGLKALGTWPFEYGLLMTRPKPWKPEDSILVVDAMYFELQSPEDRHESELALMRATMAPPLFRFLTGPGTQWDAPVVGKPLDTPPIPAADALDLRRSTPTRLALQAALDEPLVSDIGSNNWAVSKVHSSSGSALLSNDMHLGIRVPNTWYRAQWTYPDASMPGGSVTLTGVTLPGVPSMVVGSNGHVAWGFTNSYGDWSDLVLLHLDPADADQYQTAEGWRHFTHHSETIKVKGGKDAPLDIRDTVWGPVLDQDHAGVTRVIHWMAAQPEGTNLALADLEQAEDIQGAMAVANRAGMPEQNFMTADADGHIAWTIAGRIPLRSGYDPAIPSYWDKPGTGWTGWLEPAKYPRVVDPADGRLWSANARVVDGAMLTLVGDGGYDLGARAGQIRDDLHAKDSFAPADMLAIQLDDRALFLARWRSLLLRFLNPMRVANHPDRIAFRQAVTDWGGRAAVDSVGYRLVREFRDTVESMVLAPLFADCVKADPHCDYRSLPQLEGPLWALVNQQPPNLLNPDYKDWDALFMAAVNQVDAKATEGKGGLAAYTWGARNTVRLTHPLSGAVPFLPRFLDMAAVQLPGDGNMPRVQGADFGASERMSVSPGHEEEGILEMPTGQSGWLLSPYYRNSEPDWEQGKPTPFLPGKAEHTLIFKPSDQG